MSTVLDSRLIQKSYTYGDPAARLEVRLVADEEKELIDEEREQHEPADESDAVHEAEERGAEAQNAERDAEQRERERHHSHANHIR